MKEGQQAARALFERRQPGTKDKRLEESIRPQSIDDALSIHTHMANIHPIGGWKCLLPPDEGKVIAAPIFNVQAETTHVSLFEDEDAALVEPEICFVLSKDLPAKQAPYSEEDIIDAIGSAHMALELMQKRFAPDAEQSFFESLADCMMNQGMFIGPEIDKHQAMNIGEMKIEISQKSNQLSLDGTHPNQRAVAGLLWLINYLGARGVDFKKGQGIITGSFKGIVNLAFGEKTTIGYTGLGEYSVTFDRA